LRWRGFIVKYLVIGDIVSKYVLSSLFIFCVTAAYAEGSGEVYVYSVEVYNAANPAKFENYEGLTSRLAKALGSSSDSCVDLRTYRSYDSGSLVNHGVIRILTKSRLPDATVEALNKAACAQKDNLPKAFANDSKYVDVINAISKCKVSIAFKSSHVKDTKLTEVILEGGLPKKTVTYPLGESGPLPRLSDSCKSGEETGAAATAEAQKFFARLVGSNIQNGELGLSAQDLDWSFGSPNPSSLEAIKKIASGPGANGVQGPLESKGILKDADFGH
jgi:hypothetical protein